MEKQFAIRTYGFGELAQLYFPHTLPSSASRMFSKWISSNKSLYDELKLLNWKKRTKYITPKQVRLIVDYFDPP